MSLALIAGEGVLPGYLADTLRARDTPFQLCEIGGHPSVIEAEPLRFRIETLGSFITALHELGVTQVCFAGRIARPPVDVTTIDAQTRPLVPRMMTALQQGDDAALRVVLAIFEEAGLHVVAAHDIAPTLLPEAGVPSIVKPDAQMHKDAARGLDIIAAMARVDVGQACIVARGQALAIEAMGGTDWMMASLMRPLRIVPQDLPASAGYDDPIGMAAEWLAGEGAATTSLMRDPALPPGGVLVKAAKPGQERRIDLPVIGADTLERAAEIGLTGVVIAARDVMLLDAKAAIRSADRHGLCLWIHD